MSSYH